MCRVTKWTLLLSKRFCRKIRLARGNICENCGATSEETQIESHHILTYHEYPEFGKDPANILVLCQACHSGLTTPYGQTSHGSLISWARLDPELRARVADYVEANAPQLTTFVRIIRAGERAAEHYYFRNL
ncbi:MAG: HNH endonuclease [Akkermansiaceae bacterium]|nr:HNH endonuclease [Akkermansiaceae bacterium]